MQSGSFHQVCINMPNNRFLHHDSLSFRQLTAFQDSCYSPLAAEFKEHVRRTPGEISDFFIVSKFIDVDSPCQILLTDLNMPERWLPKVLSHHLLLGFGMAKLLFRFAFSPLLLGARFGYV